MLQLLSAAIFAVANTCWHVPCFYVASELSGIHSMEESNMSFVDHPDQKARRAQLDAMQKAVEESASLVLSSSNPKADAEKFVSAFRRQVHEGLVVARRFVSRFPRVQPEAP
jgi:hypothetical protein